MIQENRDLVLYSTGGSSMFPFIRWNEYILVKKVPLGAIQRDDTVVFEIDSKLKVCHRIVKIEEKNGALWFHTKGYKSNSYGVPVRQEKILGRVIAVKRKINIIGLSVKGHRFLLYKLDCFFAEYIFFVKNILAKVSFIKKLYKFLRQRKFYRR